MCRETTTMTTLSKDEIKKLIGEFDDIITRAKDSIKKIRELCNHEDYKVLNKGNTWNGWDRPCTYKYYECRECNICGLTRTEYTGTGEAY